MIDKFTADLIYEIVVAYNRFIAEGNQATVATFVNDYIAIRKAFMQ